MLRGLGLYAYDLGFLVCKVGVYGMMGLLQTFGVYGWL